MQVLDIWLSVQGKLINLTTVLSHRLRDDPYWTSKESVEFRTAG